MSIVRFVNGVTDQGQKGRSAIPVAALAEAAGLPRLLVDIRHEAVHNELPSLQLLRMASQQVGVRLFRGKDLEFRPGGWSVRPLA